MKNDEFEHLPLDDLFTILLHKKIMNKTGGAKRKAKKYYKDQYRRTGIIPKPLLLAGKGIMEGRKCSGRPRVLTAQITKRFVDMIKASSDPLDDSFIFISRNGRTIKNYHSWLEDEFNQTISYAALRRYVKEQKLKIYLDKPDFADEPDAPATCFKDVAVFDLIQVDGCRFRYFKIRSANTWARPQVIEFYDTGSRYMLAMNACFSESSKNSINIFSQFLLTTPLPDKTIRFRPDNARGFLNLKRPINELNLKYSVPKGFFLKPDFSRFNAPKDKVHLESSHRSLHNFEMRIIKFFDKRIVKTQAGYIFKKNRREKITITLLDIDLEDLRKSGILESYRQEHNTQKHYFSVNSKISAWVPAEKFEIGLSENHLISINPDDVKHFMKYGFDKIKATISKKGTLIFRNRTYYVALGAENFSRHKSTKVYVSVFSDKLFLFEHKDDGVLLGEALCQEPFEKPDRQTPSIQANEAELIIDYLESKQMVVDTVTLIQIHHKGLTLDMAQTIYRNNQKRYVAYANKLHQPETITAKALFNAFILDCERLLCMEHVVDYAPCQTI